MTGPGLRVLYVNQAGQVSGAERSLLALIDGLPSSVTPFIACPAGELEDEVRRRGVESFRIAGTTASFRLHPWHTAKGLFDIGRSSVEVRRAVARFAPDVVHANTTRASLLALLARRRSGPPVVAHIRDWTPPGAFPEFVLRVIERGAAAIFANSAYVAGRFPGTRLKQPVVVVPNPVNLEPFSGERTDGPALRRETGTPADVVVLSIIGQLAPLKAQDDAIKITAELEASGREVRLLVVGSVKFASSGASLDNATFGESLPGLARELGVEDRVVFLGERSDIADILAASDILLMPFWQDGFGRVAVEGMAAGVPVVASSVGGPAELIRSGVDGLVLPPKSPREWSRALDRLIGDAEMLRQMGENGRRHAAEFTVEKHVEQVLAVYWRIEGGSVQA
jgi:glycosyltransferase involved in cell wall biosynthesis